jgi:hypothetical protein
LWGIPKYNSELISNLNVFMEKGTYL